MKIKLFLVLLVIFAVSCEKDNNETCRITKIISYINANPSSILNYEYDEQGQVKRITDSQGSVTEFQYFKDSVVTLQGNVRTVYYLNNSGRADSSKMRFAVNPSQLAFDNKYTYNPEGFLTEERIIFSQFYNGSTLKDTSYNRFTIANENVVKAQHPNAPEIIYEYSSQEAKHYMINRGQLPFIGRSSRNLISKTVNSNGTTQSTFTYSFDGNGNVTKSTESYPGGSSVTDFTYNCQ